MTSSYQYRQVKALDSLAAECGFRVVYGTHNYPDQLTLMADGDALPIYSRDMAIAIGDVETLLIWLQGWQQSRSYLSMLKLADGDKINRAEKAHAARIKRAQEWQQRRRLLKTLREHA